MCAWNKLSHLFCLFSFPFRPIFLAQLEIAPFKPLFPESCSFNCSIILSYTLLREKRERGKENGGNGKKRRQRRCQNRRKREEYGARRGDKIYKEGRREFQTVSTLFMHVGMTQTHNTCSIFECLYGQQDSHSFPKTSWKTTK